MSTMVHMNDAAWSAFRSRLLGICSPIVESALREVSGSLTGGSISEDDLKEIEWKYEKMVDHALEAPR